MSWEDTDKAKLESDFGDIVVELIVSGERQHREFLQRNYERQVERKADLIEEIRKREEEAARQDRKRRAAMESLSDRQLAWLEKQLDGTWRAGESKIAPDATVTADQVPKDEAELLDSIIQRRLAAQGRG